ncbi:MAG: GTP cyclohydrolase [Terrimonas sp.]|nr:GTP cyclohydrolase [Terrimonas sp.]
MFIIELTYTGSLAEVDRLLEDHKLFLEKYYAEGIFLLSGRKQPRTGGIILARAETLTIIEKVIIEDPFHRHGLAEYTITEFLPSMANESLKPLL